VVENAKQLEVTLPDGTKENAELVGSDIWTDLAVVTIPSKNVDTVAQFGDSDVLKQGETVIAIGNPLGLDFYGSVTTGVISGKDRSVPVDLNGDGYEDWETEVLQTDAAINPGNSGGALVNISGELVGINSMKIAESTVEGLGFAIPINTVIPIIEELERNGEVKRPTMGIGLLDLTEVPAYYQKQTLRLPDDVKTGVVVTEVVPGSPADRAGMEKYDVIVEMDGKPIENSIDLRQHLYNDTKIGDTMKVKVYRQGKMMELKVKLTEGSQL
jgi:serine protease Do